MANNMGQKNSLIGEFLLCEAAINETLDDIGRSVDNQKKFLDTLIKNKTPVFEYSFFSNDELSATNKINNDEPDDIAPPSL